MELFFILLFVFIAAGVLYFVADATLQSIHHAEGYSTKLSYVNHVGGIPHLDKGIKVTLGVRETELDINGTHRLSFKRVTRVQVVRQEELVDKQKSVIKRAVAAGVLLGPLGSVIGGMSGIGTKKETEIQEFLSIDFLDKQGKPDTALFLVDKNEPHLNRFLKDINSKFTHIPEQLIEPSEVEPYEI